MSPQASSIDATTSSEQSIVATLEDQSANTNTLESETRTSTTTTDATAATATNNNSSALDNQLMMSLMERLQRYPSLLNTNSFLSQPLEDLLLSLPDVDEDEDDNEDGEGEGDDEVNADYRTRLANEEAKLERELIRVIQSGKAAESLKPNSGQAVTVRDSHICVGFHEEPRQGYRVWEWHGHVLLYDEVQGYSPEYIYGNYFEKLAAPPKDDRFEEKDNPFSSSGLRELIDSGDALNGRIVRRNLSSGGKR